MKMNLPNKLTLLRLCLVPIFLLVGMMPDSVIPFYLSCVVCAVLFIGTAVTDCQKPQSYHGFRKIFRPHCG